MQKAKLETIKAKVTGGETEKPMSQKTKGKEETLSGILKFFDFYSQLYSQHDIMNLVGNKSWVKEHTIVTRSIWEK